MEEYASMDKKALRAAYKNEADESKKSAIAKALAEKEDTTTGEHKMQDRVNAEADKDPAVKALVAQLAGERKAAMDAQAKLDEVAGRLAKIEQERDVAAFVAESRDVYADDEARAQYQALGGSVARAMVAELRKKGVSMASMFRGGNPPDRLDQCVKRRSDHVSGHGVSRHRYRCACIADSRGASRQRHRFQQRRHCHAGAEDGAR